MAVPRGRIVKQVDQQAFEFARFTSSISRHSTVYPFPIDGPMHMMDGKDVTLYRGSKG